MKEVLASTETISECLLLTTAVNGAEDPPDFSRKCQDYSQLQQVFDDLQNNKDYMKALKNNILVKMETFLNITKKEVIVKKYCGFCKQINFRGTHSNIGLLWLQYMPLRSVG